MADDSRHGFNQGEVEALSENISTAYSNCVDGILTILHDQVVVPISSAWYAPEACGFFGKEEEGVIVQESNLKEVVKSTSDTIFQCFDGFRQDIQSAGQNWYDNTSGKEVPAEGGASVGTEVQLATFDKIELDLDVDDIQKQDESGNVVLDDTGVSAVSTNLETIQQNIKEAMMSEENKLDAATAFIGGGQADAMTQCFDRLLEAISTIFKWLSEGEDSLSSAFDKAMQKYSDVASNIAAAYNNATFDESGEGGDGGSPDGQATQ